MTALVSGPIAEGLIKARDLAQAGVKTAGDRVSRAQQKMEQAMNDLAEAEEAKRAAFRDLRNLNGALNNLGLRDRDGHHWGDRANHHCHPVDYANRQELLATRGSEEDR
jgi:hypothetical protein